jgi:hypothetical protein
MSHLHLRGVLAGLLGGLAACGEAEVSDLSYAEVRQAARSGDEASFRKAFSEVRGQRVGWRGRVVEVAREHGDEFAEINLLLVDLDGEQGGTTDPDASYRISAATAEEMVPGREVVLIGRLEDYDWSAEGPLLRLEGQRVE